MNSNSNKSATSTSVPLCSTGHVQLRFLCPDDLEEVQTLCQDWFPIDYPMQWYQDITSSTRFFALAAVYNGTMIGLIVAEIKPYSRLNKEVRLFFRCLLMSSSSYYYYLHKQFVCKLNVTN